MPTHVYHSNTYKLSKFNTPVGRLYSEKKLSYMSFLREIRSFLISDEYINKINAHPTLLLEFAKKHISG